MLKRLAEWYLGIPAAGPGATTRWEWNLSSPLPDELPLWGAIALATLAAAAVFLIYRREAAAASPGRRALLVALRLSILALLVFLAAGLTLSVRRTGLPPLAVLLDDSASMQLEDRYLGDERQAVRAFLGKSDAETASRAALAQALLTSGDGQWLERLRQRYTLRFYRFAETCEPLARDEAVGPRQLDAIISEIHALESDGERTRLAEAVRVVLNDSRGATPAAIVLLTDGISTPPTEESLSVAAEAASDRGVPLFTVALGSRRRARDLELVDLQVDELAFVGDPLQITGHMRGAGFEGQRVALSLQARSITDAARPMHSRTLELRVPQDDAPARFEWKHTFDAPGQYELLVSVKSQPGEVDVANNEDVRLVNVLDRKIRVLLAETAPRWEFRYLKHVLEREPTIEAGALLLEADLGYAAEDRTALTHFPVREEDLLSYDVIIWGDIDASQLSPQLLTGVRNFVAETGGGLILIAGSSHTPLALRGTPLEALVPVELDSVDLSQSSPAEPAGGFRAQLTPQGAQGAPMFRMADEPGDRVEFWNQGPAFRWMLNFGRLKPGAVSLLERSAGQGAAAPAPIISFQRFGAGRVLFHATDELWLWRHLAGDRYYGRYWIQAIRDVSRARLLGAQAAWELVSDRRSYAPGERVLLSANRRTADASELAQAPLQVTVAGQSGETFQVELQPVPGDEPRWEAELRLDQPGRYRGRLSEHETVATTFRVDATPPEFQERRTKQAELASAADQTGGKSYTIATADRIPRELPAGTMIPLDADEQIAIWSRGESLLLFIVLLSAEWLLRKRSRLL